jgi:hypothetical protein
MTLGAGFTVMKLFKRMIILGIILAVGILFYIFFLIFQEYHGAEMHCEMPVQVSLFIKDKCLNVYYT